MKLGVFTALLSGMELEDTLKYLSRLGVEAVEIGTRNKSENAHIKTDELLGDNTKAKEFISLISRYGMEISALSCHGNPVHPNRKTAEKAHKDFEKTVLLAEKLGIERINTFSGCPGDSENSLYPNWVTCSWPDDYLSILDYQWDEVLIPYWTKAVKFANEHGINKICLEMHPGFCVYNPETLIKLRNSTGKTIGANFDPSHLFWQGIDPVIAIRELGEAIYHFHVKDVKIDKINTSINGVLDTKHYSKESERSWIFRTVGYGHDAQVWRDIISSLRMTGYDYVISIEHEDSLMSAEEGLSKAVGFLKNVMMYNEPNAIWWA